MEERNKISEIHRIVMNYWKMTTTSNFSNEEDEKSYTQGVLDEINEIVNLLPIRDVSGSFTKDEVIKLLKKRADNAFHKFHEYERNEILQVIDIITRLMPPSSFPDW